MSSSSSSSIFYSRGWGTLHFLGLNTQKWDVSVNTLGEISFTLQDDFPISLKIFLEPTFLHVYSPPQQYGTWYSVPMFIFFIYLKLHSRVCTKCRMKSPIFLPDTFRLYQIQPYLMITSSWPSTIKINEIFHIIEFLLYTISLYLWCFQNWKYSWKVAGSSEESFWG